MKELYKSPMNYLGNKYKLLPQILELLPDKINHFYDLFCGGLDVSLNIKANKVIANDAHEDLIWLYEQVKSNEMDKLGDELQKLDNKYFPMNFTNGKAINTYHRTGDKVTWKMLMDGKRIEYYKLREEFNEGNPDFRILLLLMLNTVGTIEFRVVNRYITFTCGNSRVNDRLKESLNLFQEKIKYINFTNNDFKQVREIAFNVDDFVYLDPPYIGTTQYKTRWYETDEKELYEILDELNERKVKFALSNFADGKNHTNTYLSKWCGKYNIHNLNDEHSHLYGIRKDNSKQRQEILVTNY